jgi:predicted secreted hydrolase
MLSVPSPGDLLTRHSTDGAGMLPGARACEFAPRRQLDMTVDDGPHNSSELEDWWWYGHFATADGHRLTYLLTFTSKPLAGPGIYNVDYAVTDLASGTFHQGHTPLIVGRPGGAKGEYALGTAAASARGHQGDATLHLDLDGYVLDLSLTAGKPVVPASDDGLVTFYCHSVYWYSRVRLQTAGTLTYAGTRTPVTGTSVLHHEWGFVPAELVGLAGWDWLDFELDDGRDMSVVVGKPPRPAGNVVSMATGYISKADGSIVTLHRGDFTMHPTRYWRRGPTCRYPVAWNVAIKGLHLRTEALVDSTELRATSAPLGYVLWPSWATAWDGPARVSGDAHGTGWMDMGRYCRA